MILATTNGIPGKELETLGMVQGNVVQAKHIGRDIMAGVKNIAGGEIKSYTDMLQEAREIATSRMVAQAEKMGADAVVMIRLEAAALIQNAVECVAYGTAVKFV